MTWYNEWGLEEKIFVALFLSAYCIYLLRTFFLAKQYKVDLGNLLKKIIIRTAYFILILLSILGPTFGDTQKEIPAEGKDIYLAIDISLSMSATDVPPSRLIVAQQKALKIISNANPYDRIALIVFGVQPYFICPLSYDHKAIENYILSLSNLSQSQLGTDVNSLLSLLKLQFQKNKNKTLEKKAIIIFSDGEFSLPTNLSIVQEIKSQCAIFCFAIGTKQGSILPQSKSLIKKNNKSVLSQLQLKPLNSLSEASEGKTVITSAQDHDDVRKIAKAIGNMKSYHRGLKPKEVSGNKYFYILLIAAILIIIDALATHKIITI